MSAQVTSDGSPQLLEAGIPVVTRDEGEVEKVDLSLEDGPEGLEPENPLVSVVLPPAADEGIEVGEEGLTITQEGAAGNSTAQLFGDKNAFYYEAQNDTDLLASPVVGGVELSDQIRSSEAPQELHFALKLPAGAALHADGGGGADVTRDGNTLARVPSPTAVDAQGAEVPVEMEVAGNSLVVKINHREGEYAYPILVDPTITEDWSSCNWYNNCNLQALSDGSWAPSESQSGWLYHSTSCIWTCWGSGRGLYLSAESGGHNANQFAAWNYTPPGETSFVKSATLNPFSRNNYANCSKLLYPQPHDYDGLWNPSSNAWAPLETNRANDYGNASPAGGGRILVVGLGTAESWAEDKCRRDIVVGGAAVWITDPDVPTWTTAPSAPDQWTDTSVVPISGTASDPGLGTKYFNLYQSPSNGQAYNFIGNTERACSGLHASPCGASWSSQIVHYSPSALPNGVNWLDVYAYDALGIEHNSQGMPVHVNVDHAAPEIALSGELFSEKVNAYKGLVTATDGSSAGFATAQSGMKSVQMYLDGQLVRRYPETATPPACSNPQQGINMGSCKFELPIELNRTITGEHLFKVVATDSLNHTTEKTVTLKLPKDEVAPSLSVSGPLKSATGLWINAAETSVTLESQDAATGVTEEAVYIDGTRVGAPATQECFAGGCSFTHAFNINLATYATGSHTVKALAVDGAGNKTESSWTVKVDGTSPSLDSAEAPEVPAGWTPQLSSFTLSYKASDSGSGVKKVEVLRPSSAGTTLISTPFNSSCTGSESSPCPVSTSGSTPISTTEMAQGIDSVTIKAYDAAGRVSNTRSITVYVDRSAPTIINADGPLVSGNSGSLIGLASELNVTVQDFGSGIASLEARLDGESLGTQSYEEIVESGGVQKCKGESCELTYATELVVGSSFEPGLHHFELVVKDWAGQTATLAHDVTIDTQPPKVQLSGSLYEAAGEELKGSTGTLEASAEDGTGQLSSGIAAIEFSVDGTPVEPRPALVVADENNNRIQEFNEKGEFVRAFGSAGSGDGQLSHPAGVAVDPKGNIWVADKSNNRIEKFNEKGEFLLKAGSLGAGNGQFSGPEGIAVDPKGNVWVADTYNGRLQEFNEKGEFVRVVSSKGSGTGQLGEPTGIDVGPGGNVWVADWQNNRVAVFNETGEFVRQFGTSGTGNGQFTRPDAIDVDSRGTVWVGDEKDSRVEAFNEKGEYITQFGSAGSGEGQFSFGYPMGLARDKKGNLWIADANNNRVQKWTMPLRTGTSRPTYASAFGSLGSSNGQFKHPANAALDSKGNLWVADENNNRIQEFNEKGEFVRAFGSAGSGDGQLSHPAGVAVDPKGNIWVADKSNNRIEKFNEKGEFLLKAGSLGAGNGQFSGPEGIAVDPKGNVWVADTYNGRLQEFNEKGEFVRVVSSKGSGTGQLGEPTGIDVGPGGNVWVADWQNNRVAVFNETGEFVRQFGTSGTGNGQFTRPDAIDVDSRGTVWVGDEKDSRVEAFNEKGEYITQFGSAGSGEGQFSFGYPMGIVSDSKGNLWVSDTNNNRMQKWAIPNYRPTYSSAFGSLGTSNGQFQHTGDVAVGNELCMPPACATQASKSFTYDEAKWGTGPHTVSVTVTDGSGNVEVKQVRVNEPLNVVAPSCPAAKVETLAGGQALGSSAAISGIEAAIPDALKPSEPYGGGPESPAVLDPEVTRNPEGVSLNELGIDVTESLMGGGIEDQSGGSFTVGQSSCMQPLQTTAAAVDPSVVDGSAVVYPNAAPSTDTVLRPTASGTAIIEHLRGEAAPNEFSWAIGLEAGEELVKLEDGGVAVVRPAGEDVAPESVPSVPPSGPTTLDNTGVQLAQSEYDLAAADAQIHGEVAMVIAAPEVVLSGGEVVPGILRITGAQVITAELPPNAVAETEAMIILTSPPAEPESICASVMASNPQYAYRVCGEEEEDTEGEDSGDPLGIRDLATTSDPEMNSVINIAVTKLENEAYESGEASASSYGSSATESHQQKKFCKHGHQVECREFALDGLQAAIAEERLFNIPSDSTEANAFRHIFWVALMHMDEEHSEDGLTWSLAHEEDQWKSHHPSIRNASRMDILNDFVGWRRVIGDNELATCESMLKKAALHAIFIGAKRDPYRWAKNNEFGYYNPVYRKLKDNIGPDASGLPVYANGTRCEEIGY